MSTRSQATDLLYTVETAIVGRDVKDNVVVYNLLSQAEMHHLTGNIAKLDADIADSMSDKKA